MTSRDGLSQARASAQGEPIAIVGAGCRFPGGADDLDSYWRLLREGRDAVRPVPADRWDGDDPGTARAYAREMASLDDIDGFDAAFFGISPREAASMDPQHRLLLEVAWEAAERASWSPQALAGSSTGVFVGIYSDDYTQERLYRRAADQIDGHAGLAMMRSLAAGRIAYALDLHGPAMALDAACASSLLAIHLACRSLRAGECDRALAGGVNLILSPQITLGLCQMKALSPTGRCRTFSADADGFVRGEGCGVVALRRLDDAIRDGDPVLAVIRGSAVNHDGRSNGISAPNGSAQQAVIRAALADAGIPARSVGYVEAHGTGTMLGDPIELRALGAVYGAERAAPVLVGSAKTNFGHLEAAAGVAGLLKVVLALRHGEVPPNLHFSAPNPYVPWEGLGLAVPTAPAAFPADGPMRGAVSAFGMSGTNAHVILEAAPALAEAPAPRRSGYIAALSARTEAALRALATRQAQALAVLPQADPGAVALTLNAGRGRFPVRAAVEFANVGELAGRLEHLADIATAPARRPQVLFACADGDGLPSDGGRALMASDPAFAAAVAACEEAGLKPAPCGPTAAFVMAYALANLWRSWGVVPDRIAGQGAGEVVAACLAGVLSLADAGALLRARQAALGHADVEAGRLDFIAAVRALALKPPAVPLVSGLLGRDVAAEVTSPAYWWAQLAGVPASAEEGAPDTFVVPIAPTGAVWADIAPRLAAAHMAGLDPDWAAVDAPRRRLSLPTYPFEHGSYFIPRPDGVSALAPRGLAGSRVDLAGRDEVRFTLTLGGERHRFLLDHRFGGRATFPMAAFAEVALQNGRAALGSGAGVEDLAITRPLVLPDRGAVEAQTVVGAEGAWQFFARSADGSWVLHATARLVSAPAPVAAWGAGLSAPAVRTPGAAIYGGLTQFGFDYRPAFRGLKDLAMVEEGVTAHAELPRESGSAADYLVHPALLDACLVASSAILPQLGPGVTWMPRGIGRVAVFAPAGSAVTSILRLRDDPAARSCHVDLMLRDATGQVVAQLDRVAFVRIAHGADFAEDEGIATQPELLRLRWQRADLSGTPTPRVFALVGDDVVLVRRLADALAARGEVVVHVPSAWDAGADVPGDWLSAARAKAPDGRCHMVYLATTPADPGAADVPASHLGLLRLIQAAGRSAHRATLRLDVVTRGTQRVAGEPVTGVAEAGLWGLSRVAASEYPDFGQTRIDLDPEAAGEADLSDLAACLIAAPAGEDLALRRGVCFAARLVADRPAAPEHPIALPQFDGRPPGPGEVVIDVVASGLNFRDVLHGMGLLPDSADKMPYGLECSGVVADVGPGVAGLAVNMPVMAGLTVGSLAGRVRVPAAFVVPKPESLSFRDAATLPLAFLTAHYALDRLAGLKRGERVLIHAAAGGVGQAAIQVAQRAGAEIFATASPAKWGHLRRHGVTHLFNSRTAGFAAEIRRRTGGRGVDVVLNSLSGEAIAESFAALADGGRFIEIGKMGIWSAADVAALGRDIAYHPFDLWDIKQDEGLIAQMMAQMVARLADGTLVPLRSELFGIDDAGAAFQHMARARHMGKIVLWQAAAEAGDTIRGDATFLVTGGLGALGLHAASWLVRHGARSIALVGRSAPGEAAREAVAALRRAGARVEVFEADVSEPAAVEHLLAALRQTMAPLRGIIHAAGVLDDALLVNQSPAHFARVLAPKLRAAWLLHRATLDEPLEMFVLYASASGLLGLPGQANYAAANAALDALAEHRASLGLPAQAIDWGPWEGAGMAQTLDSDGMGRISPAAGAAVLGQLMARRPGHVAVLPTGWQGGLKRGVGPSGLLAGFAAAAPPDAAGAAAPPFRLRLEAAGAAERLRLLRAHVRLLAATALEFPTPEAVDPARPLEDMGFDSLMNMELKAALEQDLGVLLKATLAYDHPSIDALVRHLAEEVLGWREEAPAAGLPQPQDDAESALLAELNALKY
ncbi:type I polyketide synthase [Xanthobacter autotrophicus]|uniref:type I polyketide synthase n=1 Tax=Xanthobacter autotrophicus TaxID=280 RepID=UPI0024A6EAE4|nr:SDR family NAD(P)-dependent oxidoreductase [Xanthobacter autotrophicus]MDI4656773.1 SDR family NAD(P)-dependent oxidoreductase [Xanthobacter autotrophicus]